MDMGPHLIEMLLTPPGVVIVLLLLTFVGYLRNYWVGTTLLGISTFALVALSIPLTAHWLLRDLQSYAKPPELVPMAERGPQASVYVPKNSLKDPPGAIVVLGSGRNPDAPEYNFEDTVSALGLERLRYAAYLQDKTRVPILVSGGAPGGETTAEADHMKKVLADEFKANVKWQERQSRNTAENARFSQAILADAKITHVYLVTHAWHMRRAARAFESAGIKVTAAPTGFISQGHNTNQIFNYLPSSRGMLATSLAIRERLAFAWYDMQSEITAPAEKPAQPASAPASTPAKR